MGAKELRDEIGKRIDQEIREVSANADARMIEIRKQIDETIAKKTGGIEASAKKSAELEYKRIMTQRVLKKKQLIEQVRAEAVEKVFERAREKITSMGASDKKSLLQKLERDAKKQIPGGISYVDKAYAKLLPKAKTKPLGDFGVVVESKDGSMIINNLVGARLERIMEEDLSKVASHLF